MLLDQLMKLFPYRHVLSGLGYITEITGDVTN
jgi:hypothetical protein